ncbi:Uncharacterised protein [Vibrio cholerae]|nr:Uncharacterised protein [Vibrio cholerae]CSI37342.1 Uncharacterised protein [Vibrio cholerae]CSI67583.1 Uncharacterised protein [Vibrio cholerae]
MVNRYIGPKLSVIAQTRLFTDKTASTNHYVIAKLNT